MSSNIWDKIELKIPKAIEQVLNDLTADALSGEGLTDKLRTRYEDGSRQHGGEWLNWEHDTFWDNIKEEVYDMVLYRAMDLVRDEHARRYGDPNVSYNQATDSERWNMRASLGTWRDNDTAMGTGESA